MNIVAYCAAYNPSLVGAAASIFGQTRRRGRGDRFLRLIVGGVVTKISDVPLAYTSAVTKKGRFIFFFFFWVSPTAHICAYVVSIAA